MNISEILQFDRLDPKSVPSPSFDEGLFGTWDGIINDDHYAEVEPIPFELTTKVFKAFGNIAIFAFQNFDPDYRYSEQRPMIFLGLVQYYDGLRVENVRVEPSLRGHNYGMKLYLAVTKYYNKPLYSGAQQTSASNNGIWKKLIQNYPDRIVGFDQATKKDLRLTITSAGPLAGKKPIYQQVKDTSYDKNKHYGKSVKTRLLKLLP